MPLVSHPDEATIVSNSEHIEGIGSAAAVTNKRARDHDEDSPADPPIDPTSSNAQSQVEELEERMGGMPNVTDVRLRNVKSSRGGSYNS